MVLHHFHVDFLNIVNVNGARHVRQSVLLQSHDGVFMFKQPMHLARPLVDVLLQIGIINEVFIAFEGLFKLRVFMSEQIDGFIIQALLVLEGSHLLESPGLHEVQVVFKVERVDLVDVLAFIGFVLSLCLLYV